MRNLKNDPKNSKSGTELCNNFEQIYFPLKDEIEKLMLNLKTFPPDTINYKKAIEAIQEKYQKILQFFKKLRQGFQDAFTETKGSSVWSPLKPSENLWWMQILSVFRIEWQFIEYVAKRFKFDLPDEYQLPSVQYGSKMVQSGLFSKSIEDKNSTSISDIIAITLNISRVEAEKIISLVEKKAEQSPIRLDYLKPQRNFLLNKISHDYTQIVDNLKKLDTVFDQNQFECYQAIHQDLVHQYIHCVLYLLGNARLKNPKYLRENIEQIAKDLTDLSKDLIKAGFHNEEKILQLKMSKAFDYFKAIQQQLQKIVTSKRSWLDFIVIQLGIKIASIITDTQVEKYIVFLSCLAEDGLYVTNSLHQLIYESESFQQLKRLLETLYLDGRTCSINNNLVLEKYAEFSVLVHPDSDDHRDDDHLKSIQVMLANKEFQKNLDDEKRQLFKESLEYLAFVQTSQYPIKGQVIKKIGDLNLKIKKLTLELATFLQRNTQFSILMTSIIEKLKQLQQKLDPKNLKDYEYKFNGEKIDKLVSDLELHLSVLKKSIVTDHKELTKFGMFSSKQFEENSNRVKKILSELEIMVSGKPPIPDSLTTGFSQ